MFYRICLLFIGYSLAVGCAGTTQPAGADYDPGRDRTTYRSGPIPVPVDPPGSGYGTDFELLRMDLTASCTGRGCRPDQVRLTLSTTGGAELYLGERTFAITADEETFTWKDPSRWRQNETELVTGTVLQVTMSIGQLQKVARAEKLEATIGTIVVEMGRRQERIRAFLAEMESGTDAL